MKKFIVLSIVLLMLAGFAITSSAQEEVPVDIKPQSCPNPLNVKSKGVLPVAILGTDIFDVTLIDPASIRLWLEVGFGEGIAPLRWYLEDVATPLADDAEPSCLNCTEEGPDGVMDLTLKFDKQAVVAEIGEVSGGDCLVLTLTGELLDGTPIAGVDAIFIIKKDK